MNHHSRGVSILVTVVLIALVAVTGLIVVSSMKKTRAPSTVQTETAAPVATPTPVDTTDTGLEKDSAGVDAELKALDKDAANIDAGINDKQGDLSE